MPTIGPPDATPAPRSGPPPADQRGMARPYLRLQVWAADSGAYLGRTRDATADGLFLQTAPTTAEARRRLTGLTGRTAAPERQAEPLARIDRTTGRAGLGLCLAARAARTQGGAAALRPDERPHGATFTLSPRAAQAPRSGPGGF